MDRKTAAALSVAERRLGYELTIVQGPYNPGGVGASGCTHDRGGVVDLASYDQANKVRVLRDVGFAAWFRPAISGLWGAHVHAVLIGHQDLSPAARRQVWRFEDGLDGLAAGAVDPNPYRPEVKSFSYAAWWKDHEIGVRLATIKAKRKQLFDKISAKKAKRERLKIEAQKLRQQRTY